MSINIPSFSTHYLTPLSIPDNLLADGGKPREGEPSPSAPSVGGNGAATLKAELLSGIKCDLAACQDTLARNKTRLACYVKHQDSNVESAKEALSALGDGRDGRGDRDAKGQKSPSAASVEFDESWQVQYKTAADKFSGAAAAEQALRNDAELEPSVVDDGADAGKAFKSYAELWQDAVDGIGTIKAGYLEVYETVVERYTTFYSDFSDFMSGLTAYLNVTTDDKGNQTMEFKPEVLAEIDKLIQSYGGEQGVLFPSSGTATQAEAEKWASELGLPAHCVEAAPGGGYRVMIDISPLVTIRDNLNDVATKPMSTFQYQSWRSGFDAQSGKFQTTLQTLTTKYGNANGMYDTLVKVLSSSITSGADTLKQILASI